MIRHCVFVRFRPEVSDTEVVSIFEQIASLRNHLTGIVGMDFGRNVSPELGMDKGYSQGFVIDFESADDRDRYLDDPAHTAAGTRLVAAAAGGTDGILVFDLVI
jgi:hypothetical protein